MSKGAVTREKIVAAAAKLFRRAGYAGTAVFAALVGVLIRWRANRGQRNKRAG